MPEELSFSGIGRGELFLSRVHHTRHIFVYFDHILPYERVTQPDLTRSKQTEAAFALSLSHL